MVVLAAVVASLAASFGMFYKASVDAYYMISHLFHFGLKPELCILDCREEMKLYRWCNIQCKV